MKNSFISKWYKKYPYATIEVLGKKRKINLYDTEDSYFQLVDRGYNSLINVEFFKDKKSAEKYIKIKGV